MNEKIKSLMASRDKNIADMRKLIDEAPNGKLSADNETRYNELEKDVDSYSTQIDREARLHKHEKEISKIVTEPTQTSQSTREQENKEKEAEFRTRLLRAYCVGGAAAAFATVKNEEERALAAGALTEGGVLVPAQTWVQQLIKAVDDKVYMRGLANVITMTESMSLGVPVLDADPADADWTTELATGSEDSTMKFGKRELKPNPLAKSIKISNTLLQRSVIPAEQLVRDRLAYKFAITQEKNFLTGNGANQPLGVMTAHANGIPTSRDVSTGNSTTAMTFDGLIECMHACKEQYMAEGSWMFHRDGVKQIRKLKDGNGQYLWQPAVTAGNPATILERPVIMSEYMPNTFTTGLYVGIFGAFKNYWIAEVLGMTIQKLVELYAATNQVGFIGRMELDGMPVLAEAFARVKLA